MKRTPLTRRTTLPRGAALRRVALMRRPKTRVGEFSPKVRAALWRRWDGLCCVCGDLLPRKGWEAQHRRARAMGGSTDPVTVTAANGLAVHKHCHRFVEAEPGFATLCGWRVAQGKNPAQVPVRLWNDDWVDLHTDGSHSLIYSSNKPIGVTDV